MRARARANGNIVDSVPESLIGVLYDPIEEPDPDEPIEISEPEETERASMLLTPEAPLRNVAHADPPKKRRTRKRRPK